jgi:cold shock CspA family protein
MQGALAMRLERRQKTMSNGTVRWFNRTIGAGFIRTDDGENVMFLNNAIRDFDPQWIKEGLRVSLDIQESQHGFTAVSVKALECA